MSSTDIVRHEMPSEEIPQGKAVERLNNEQIRYIAGTEIVPRHLRGKPEAILATILKGRALGLDDIHSLTAINFIEGKATLAAETMVTLVRRAGHSITWEDKPGEFCKVTGTRKNGDSGSVTWTMQMAKDAGLATKDNWKRYPDTMLYWRAVSQLCRRLFADVLMGVSYTPDEAEEAAERGAVTQAVSDLPGLEEQHVRTEALAGPSEAQLNRLARLEERSGDGYKMVLRGVYGVEMASELDADAATKYEAQLEMALPPEDPDPDSDRPAPPDGESVDESAVGPDSAEDPIGGVTSQEPSDGPGATSEGEPADATGGDAGEEAASSSAELPDEPAPEDEDEVVEAEVVEEIAPERLIELAAETLIPLGTYKGKKLGEIHDGWIDYALNNTSRLPEAFVEALELFARERKPAIWTAVRGE